MSDVLVVFGSSSDKPVYSRIMAGLKENGISAGLRICSAHRTPTQLEKIVAGSKAKVIVAGAGLSAALPGAIASKTIKPVIGVPVGSNYAGLDALLSIAQMPSGFPVISTGVDAAEQAVEAARLALQEHNFVKVVASEQNEVVKQRIEKAKGIATRLGMQFEFLEAVEAGNVSPKSDIVVHAVEWSTPGAAKLLGALVLNVPILQESAGQEALEFLEQSKKGLWLGLNRVDNAIIAAAELLNVHSGKYSKKLLAYRSELAKKTMEADAKEGKGG